MSDSIDETKHLVRVAEQAAQAETIEKLRQAVAASSRKAVAERIGVSRTAISLILSGKYGAHNKNGASPDNTLKKFEAVYSQIDCPHLNQALTREQCRDFSTKPSPSNPLGLQHYRACLSCKHREV